MQRQSWVYEGASSEAWGVGGIGVFRTQGIVRPKTAGEVLASAQGAVDRWQLGGLVASYEDAAMRVDADKLLGHALSVTAGGGALLLPTALVVQADDLPMWRLYAELMARNGILRGVFTRHEDAMSWVRLQAAIHLADRHRSPKSGR